MKAARQVSGTCTLRVSGRSGDLSGYFVRVGAGESNQAQAIVRHAGIADERASIPFTLSPRDYLRHGATYDFVLVANAGRITEIHPIARRSDLPCLVPGINLGHIHSLIMTGTAR
jgi:hypothetical protein